MKLTVVIVSYNVKHYIEQCIVSVQQAARGIDHDIIVVDNASSDDTVGYLRQRFAQGVTIVESMHNLGFARANNIAINQSQSQYVLLLNPDTFISEDCLNTVIAFMDEHPRAGAAAAQMHNADGTLAPESRRALPTPWVSLLKMLGFSRRYYMSHLSWHQPSPIEVVSGAFMMLRREALDSVGLLDEDFFMYGEDIDLSYRIVKGGYQNWYIPAPIVHYKGESTQKSSFRYVHVFYQAMLIFFRKHYGHLSFLVTLPVKLAIYFRAFIALLQMLWQRMRASLGFYDRPAGDAAYLFVGTPAMLDQCRELSRRKGLTAAFLDVADLDALDSRLGAATCVVYDVDTLSFAQVISHAAALTQSHPDIGTCSLTRQLIITPSEVIPITLDT